GDNCWVGATLCTKGASCSTGAFRRDRTSHHSRAEVNTSIATTAMKNSATIALSRSLMISRAALESAELASEAAWDRKPSFGSVENTFCQPAVIVTVINQASGTSVTQM